MLFDELLKDLTLEENGYYIRPINKLVLSNSYIYRNIKNNYATDDLEVFLKSITNKFNLFKTDLEMLNLFIRINKENKILIGEI